MMKRTAQSVCFALAMVFASSHAVAQTDPHFSVYYIYPSWLNPALTGGFDGTYRVSGIYRTQWGNISSPYSTPGISAEVQTNRNANFGASILNQTAGGGGYSYTTAYGSAAYTGLRFGPMESKRVVFGLQFGLIQRGFNKDKLQTGDQVINGIYDPTFQTSDLAILSSDKSSSFDMSAGAFYYDAMPGQTMNVFGGFSVAHITRPKDNFSKRGDATIPMRYTFHGGVRYKVNDKVSITPNVLFMKQGTAKEIMAGAYGQFNVNMNTDVMAGLNYRVNDAIAPFVGFIHKSFLLGASYDINTSDLGRISSGTSSFEISLSYIGRKATKTPEAEFVCPRL